MYYIIDVTYVCKNMDLILHMHVLFFFLFLGNCSMLPIYLSIVCCVVLYIFVVKFTKMLSWASLPRTPLSSDIFKGG